MLHSTPPSTNRPTLAGFWRGVALSWAFIPGSFFFGAAIGSLSQQKGLSLAETLLMTGLLYAGSSQFVALEAWQGEWRWIDMAVVVAAVAVVNSRMFLMSAALEPWLRGLPPAYVYSQHFFLTDANYIAAVRYREGGGTDPAILLGVGVALWLNWTLSVIPGYLLGAVVADQKKFAIDLIMPVYFAALGVPLWKGHAQTRAWLVAGAAALALYYFVPGYWYLIGGALAGITWAAFEPDAEPAS
ncbi:MAG: AzlC family ABC transporter permease [Beijerinckiaceae bacterium]